MSTINTNLFFTLIAASVTAFLGLLVFIHNRKGFSNGIFITHAITGTLWAIVNYLSVTSQNEYVIIWIRLVLFFAVPYIFLFYLFVQNFPSETYLGNKKNLYPLITLITLMMGLTLSPAVFNGTIINQGKVIPVTGPLISTFGILLVIFFLLSIFITIKKYISTAGEIKKQWISIGLGLSVAYSLLIFFVFLRVIILNDTSFVPYSPLFILPTFIGTAYAILRHRLFNIKVIAAEALTFALLLVSFIQLIDSYTKLGLWLGLAVIGFVLIFGFFLIRSVLNEVRQREKLQTLTTDLAIANEKLKELDKQKDEFLSFASHDLKSPVSKMKQWASLIYDKTYSEEAQILDTAYKIKSTGDRAIRLVDEFLNIRKLEEGKMEYNFELKDMVSFTRGIVEDFKPVAKQKGLELNFNTSAPLVNASIDTIKMRQVIENLIDNSIKYTETGFINVTIAEEQKSILITIKDSGGGMDPAIIPTLFEQFHREAGVAKKIQGTGLGLYIAKQIMIAHHGEIWAESEGRNKGSTFHIRIAKA